MACTPIQGGCLCEGIAFEITPPTKWCAHCHCSMCRRAHGAGIVTWFGIDSAQLRLTRGSDLLRWHRSSAGARRGFCGRCGSMLFFEGERWPGETHVTRASVPGEIDRAPAAHVHFDRRVAWLDLHDGLKKLGGTSGMQPLE